MLIYGDSSYDGRLVEKYMLFCRHLPQPIRRTFRFASDKDVGLFEGVDRPYNSLGACVKNAPLYKQDNEQQCPGKTSYRCSVLTEHKRTTSGGDFFSSDAFLYNSSLTFPFHNLPEVTVSRTPLSTAAAFETNSVQPFE